MARYTLWPSILVNGGSAKPGATVRFSPRVRSGGRYHVYTYVTKLAGLAPYLDLNVLDGRSAPPVRLNTKGIKVSGQTSGEWATLGEFYLRPGVKAYIEVVNNDSSSMAIADAVIIVPK